MNNAYELSKRLLFALSCLGIAALFLYRLHHVKPQNESLLVGVMVVLFCVVISFTGLLSIIAVDEPMMEE